MDYILSTAIEKGIDLWGYTPVEYVLEHVRPVVRLLLDRQAKEIAEAIEADELDDDNSPPFRDGYYTGINQAAVIARNWSNR